MQPVDLDSSYSTFWPKLNGDIRLALLDIAPEQYFAGKPDLVQAGKRLRLLANALHNLGALGINGSAGQMLLDEAASVIETIADQYRDDEREQLRRMAKYVRGGFIDRELLPICAGYLEREVFLLFGPLATWHSKTKERRISFVMGQPNNELVDFVNRAAAPDGMLKSLQTSCSDQLVVRPTPTVCFLDLVFCGGESDLFPKHYAYFLPENAGYPWADCKKTVVFGNVHKHKFDKASSAIGRRFINGFANGFIAESTADSVTKALSVWIRAHDIGHCIMREETNWRKFSKRDYFWSMACQELWADLAAYAFVLEPGTIELVGLTYRSMCDLVLAEMMRYASGGQTAPDAVAANWELAWLYDSGALRVKDGVLHAERTELSRAIRSLLAAVSSCLCNQVENMHRLTSALRQAPELERVVENAGEFSCLQIYSTSL